MVCGLKLGDHMQADTVAVLGGRRAGDVCGPWAHKRVLHGLVVEVVGTGHQQKLNGTNVTMNRYFHREYLRVRGCGRRRNREAQSVMLFTVSTHLIQLWTCLLLNIALTCYGASDLG